jgi:phosphoribosyl-AMP cyclohydrolase
MSTSPVTPDFDKLGGLLPVVVQEKGTGVVLMFAYMNREAFDETLATGRAVYYSRSRQKLWRKGEESGHMQHVKRMFIDCDADTLLLEVEQIGGAACHEGYKSCFFRQIDGRETRVVGERVFDPARVYPPSQPTTGPETI